MASELLLNLTERKKAKREGESDTQRGEREDFKENSFEKISSTASFHEVLEL